MRLRDRGRRQEQMRREVHLVCCIGRCPEPWAELVLSPHYRVAGNHAGDDWIVEATCFILKRARTLLLLFLQKENYNKTVLQVKSHPISPPHIFFFFVTHLAKPYVAAGTDFGLLQIRYAAADETCESFYNPNLQHDFLQPLWQVTEQALPMVLGNVRRSKPNGLCVIENSETSERPRPFSQTVLYHHLRLQNYLLTLFSFVPDVFLYPQPQSLTNRDVSFSLSIVILLTRSLSCFLPNSELTEAERKKKRISSFLVSVFYHRCFGCLGDIRMRYRNEPFQNITRAFHFLVGYASPIATCNTAS
ncbi:hypothetical protein NPIL_274531 [Nephila pilipes]|uniref:Uncharacterized protein n=1 Tax=Nephila pilipes TaxID=299642 RepID=A0A8X6NLZ2_NEPPI|nr:hypothetical protein NPIL_274531 [Nephila pilipes]